MNRWNLHPTDFTLATDRHDDTSGSTIHKASAEMADSWAHKVPDISPTRCAVMWNATTEYGWMTS